MAQRLVFCILIYACTPAAFSQNTNDYSRIILGSWVTQESLLTGEIESPATSSYFEYEFLPSNVMFYASNEFERGERSMYAVRGDTLEMFGWEYAVQRYNDEELELVAYPKLVQKSFTVTLVRKEKYDSLWKIQKNTAPVFEGNFHLYDYLFSNFTTPAEFEKKSVILYDHPRPVPPKDDIKVRITIAVDSIGKVTVTDLIAGPRVSKRQVENMRQKMANTSGYWFQPVQEGANKPVTLSLIFVKQGESSLRFNTKAWTLYNRAVTSFEKENYLQAIQLLNDAVSLNANKFQFYLLRAMCYLQLDDADKFCNDVFRAHALNPFVKLTNDISVKGEIVQIKCGTH